MTIVPAAYAQFGYTLAFAERTLSAVLRDHLAERGTEPETWYALQLLATRGPALDRTTLTANLKPLERRGLVKVVVDPDDRRSRRLILTAAGRASLAAAAPIWKREHARVERLLHTAGADVVRTGLRELS